jgi:hypothetical protein
MAKDIRRAKDLWAAYVKELRHGLRKRWNAF